MPVNEEIKMTLDSVVTPVEETVITEQVNEPKPEVTLPPKFKDKTLEDVVKSYVELESAFGRQGNEIGELRKLTDKLLDIAKPTKKQPELDTLETEITDTDFYGSPKKTVEKLVKKSIDEVSRKVEELELADTKKVFEAKHSDVKEILQDEEFGKWVLASNFRKKLFQQADSYDFEAADELFTSWKERKALVAASRTEEAAKVAEKKDKSLKDATSETGSTGAKTTKKYKRSDLIRLRLENPEKYTAMHEEIYRAYQEGRVI